MTPNHQPVIPAQTKLPEITFRGVVLAILLAMILAASNTYLALKVGILTSASIPAAILSMGILRFFKGSNILENNLVQTAASAGEAIAGGIVYTIPGLIIIHYWTHFDYFQNMAIGLIGGILGVLFSVPLRRVLVTDPYLKFPEGQAIAEVLKLSGNKSVSIKDMICGSIIGAVIELAQNGFKIVASGIQGWFTIGSTALGFGTGFSATLIGAGYLIGANFCFSLLIGAIVCWLIISPILVAHFHVLTGNIDTTQAVLSMWSSHIRYIGIGSMLTAGVWTLLTLARPFFASMNATARAFLSPNPQSITRTDYDLPLSYVLIGSSLLAICIYFLFAKLFPLNDLNLAALHIPILLGSVIYVVVLGFISAAICGYFSGLVGVSATPGSSVIIGGLLFAALTLRTLLNAHGITLDHVQVLNSAAIVIIITALITGIACIANDNIQDLKVGYIVGSTPWKQQIMLLIGVVTASAIIPPIMELLFNVYGIGGVFPHPGMDPSQMLAAPPASMLATATQAVFDRDLPWNMLTIGALISVFFILINHFLKKYKYSISAIGISMGIYLPLSSSMALFIGGLIAFIIQRNKSPHKNSQSGILLACGLVAGAALMDVLLAIPFAISGDPDVLAIMPTEAHPIAVLLGILITVLIGMWFNRIVNLSQK